MKERSTKFININVVFQKFLKARNHSKSKDFMKVTCYFEEYVMYKLSKKIEVIVFKESICLFDIDSQSIQVNHVDMCKFENEDGEEYKRISQKLSQ